MACSGECSATAAGIATLGARVSMLDAAPPGRGGVACTPIRLRKGHGEPDYSDKQQTSSRGLVTGRDHTSGQSPVAQSSSSESDANQPRKENETNQIKPNRNKGPPNLTTPAIVLGQWSRRGTHLTEAERVPSSGAGPGECLRAEAATCLTGDRVPTPVCTAASAAPAVRRKSGGGRGMGKVWGSA